MPGWMDIDFHSYSLFINKMDKKRTIVVFDFDGTITTKDTLLEFIKYCFGSFRLYIGFLLYSPMLIVYKLGFYPNWKAKQKIFSYFFKGMRYTKFKQMGEDFAEIVDTIVRAGTLQCLYEHKKQGHKIYVISASIDEWLSPWCFQHGVEVVLGTKIEVTGDGCLSGRFVSKNCYGQEKVNRLLEAEPDRNNYYLYVYGDSRGDREIIAFADKGKYITQK